MTLEQQQEAIMKMIGDVDGYEEIELALQKFKEAAYEAGYCAAEQELREKD